MTELEALGHVLRRVSNDNAELTANLTATQERCTDLVNEIREVRREHDLDRAHITKLQEESKRMTASWRQLLKRYRVLLRQVPDISEQDVEREADALQDIPPPRGLEQRVEDRKA